VKIRSQVNFTVTSIRGRLNGGYPHVKDASGNIVTEDPALISEQMGIETGFDASKISAISRSIPGIFP